MESRSSFYSALKIKMRCEQITEVVLSAVDVDVDVDVDVNEVGGA